MNKEITLAWMKKLGTAEAALKAALRIADLNARLCRRAETMTVLDDVAAVHSVARTGMWEAREVATAALCLSPYDDRFGKRAWRAAERAQDYTVRIGEHANRLRAG